MWKDVLEEFVDQDSDNDDMEGEFCSSELEPFVLCNIVSDYTIPIEILRWQCAEVQGQGYRQLQANTR